MVEREDAQGIPVQPQSTESQLIIETRKYADQFIPSPLEEAFDAEIQRRFKTALLEPSIDEYDRLVRLSYPVFAGDSFIHDMVCYKEIQNKLRKLYYPIILPLAK